jgi:hypothetical protein
MIPLEMTHYPNWVMWRYEERNGKQTKVPYQVRTLHRASDTEPSHWATYGEALKLLESGQRNFNGIGFVFSVNDPFVGIDLDPPGDNLGDIERARLVLETFCDTYCEISPSGEGMHIILRGDIRGGRRRGKIEIYGSERFFTMTGNAYRDLPIGEADYFLMQLWDELGGRNKPAPGLVEIAGSPQKFTDEEIYKKACETNDKFKALFEGHYREWYGSQSEADFALVNILSFYSRNREQIARMFHCSALGKRKKAYRVGTATRKGYLEEMIDRSFDNLAPDISLDQLMGTLMQQIEADRAAKAITPTPMLGEGWELPPGLVGDIAQFVYSQAPRPVQEVALAAAIGLMSGICGRSYNISSTGLNQYILVLAETGRGKEALKSGISKLMKYVAAQVPGANDFVGPAEIASGQALIKYIGIHPCFVSIVGEFGLAIEQMCGPNAPAHLQSLKRIMLDLFGKSGKMDTLNPTVYSDKANNTGIVQSPAFSLLGETTPDSFFPHLTADIVSQGLLPRFTCIEYNGTRPRMNKAHAEAVPSEELITTLATLCSNALTLATNRQVIDVYCDSEAQAELDRFDEECDSIINGAETDVARQLWSRAHMKLLKIAGLIAVGCDIFQPVVTLPVVQWSKNLIKRDIANILNRFETGRVGRDNNEQNQNNRLLSICKDYIYRPFDESMRKYAVNPELHRDRVIQYGYLSKRLIGQPAFKDDRMGAAFALKRTIESCIADGVLVELSAQQLNSRYKYSGKAYFVVDITKLG